MKPLAGLVRHEGNDSLFLAIEMSLVSGFNGIPLHLHVEGLRGTGKTTILRAARAVFPRIRRIKGCLYNCDPEDPHCPEHAAMSGEQISEIGVEEIPMPFLEISHSAKVGTVVGSIDLKRITDRTSPEAAILPGTIPQAHRGVIFVDEINRLAETSPELADILLSVMGTKPGRIQIEETGLPVVELPVRVSVWAASNPDEEPGPLEDIRRQLADRFDLVANVSRPTNPQVVKSIFAGCGDSAEPLKDAAQIASRAAFARGVVVPGWLQETIASLYVDFSLESLRAVEALQHGCRISAALDLRTEAEMNDLIRVVPLALHHRVSVATMAQILKYLTERAQAKEGRYRPPSPGQPEQAAAALASAQKAGGQTDAQNAMERLFARIRELMGTAPGAGACGQQAGRQAASASQTGGRGGYRREQGGGDSGGGAGSSFADPMDVPVFAPRSRARPLLELAAAEMVKTEEDLR